MPRRAPLPCEKSVSTFYCPSLSQTSPVGKVSVKLFHKLSKNTASRKPTKTSSLQAKNYQTTSAVSKTLPGFQNSKQNSKSTNKVKSTSAILYFWINSVHGNKKHLKPKYLVVHSSKWVFTKFPWNPLELLFGFLVMQKRQ